jgi:hypothetical protein
MILPNKWPPGWANLEQIAIPDTPDVATICLSWTFPSVTSASKHNVGHVIDAERFGKLEIPSILMTPEGGQTPAISSPV